MRRLFPLALGLLAAGCMATGGAPKPALAPTKTTVTVRKPAVTVAPGYDFTKVTDGVSITVTPNAFQEVRMINRTMTEKQALLTLNDQITWKITDTPYVAHMPDGLEFAIKITNSLDHVLRLIGSVVTLSVDGKPYSTDSIEELSRIILTPNQSWEGNLAGPTCGELSDQASIVFTIYDVVTAVDAANNPTKRTNFEWVFAYTLSREDRELEIQQYEKKMTRADAAAFVRGGSLVAP